MKKMNLPSMGKNVFRKLYIPSAKRGQAPGTPVYTGEQTEEPRRIRLMDFSPDSYEEIETEAIQDIFPQLDSENCSWINVTTVGVEFTRERQTGNANMDEIPGSDKEWPADLALLALGFTGPERDNVVHAWVSNSMSVATSKRTGNTRPALRTSLPPAIATAVNR